MDNKEILKKLLLEFKEYFNTESEYGTGYLDALTELCQQLNIKCIRKPDDLIIE